jgi:predicted SnoaL-like aldol condensation-catalyzing enzyme
LQIKQLLALDQYIFVLAEGSFAGGPKTVIYDLYRVQGNCIVEHWDALMEEKANTVSKHPYF